MRCTVKDLLWLMMMVALAVACNSSAPSTPRNSAQDEKMRQTKWNVEVLFRMDEMEKAGKSAEEIEDYRLKNYDKPPKDFKFDD